MPHLARATLPHRPASPVAPARAAARPSGQVYATLINLSGRRRFTSQRVVLYAVLAHQGDPDAMALSRAALATFRDAHHTLMHGKENVPGLFCPELEAAYRGPTGADLPIQAFLSLAERAQDAVSRGSAAAATLLAELVAAATPLLAVLNRVTQVYEDLAAAQAQASRTQLQGVLGDIESIARHARIVAFNAQVAAARAGAWGREFAVVAGELSAITSKIDGLVHEALGASSR
jgi:hypothetical protein